MSALVGYGSSDEEEDDTASVPQDKALEVTKTELPVPGVETTAPIAGPTRPPIPQPSEDVPQGQAPPSPNTLRAQIQALTMPRFPNFDIPRSPSPPPANSEEAAELTARTRKFERFLELKKQGVHFNDRLEASPALRNPQVLQKLTEFAGISAEEQYENTLGNELGIPTRWPAGHLEDLVASNLKRQKKEKTSRTKLDFVTGKTQS